MSTKQTMVLAGSVVLVCCLSACRTGRLERASLADVAPKDSSCSIECEVDGKPRSMSVGCQEGFVAVCQCEQKPYAGCRRFRR